MGSVLHRRNDHRLLAPLCGLLTEGTLKRSRLRQALPMQGYFHVSRLRTHCLIQKSMVAAMTMADMKVWAHLSYRVATRRQSLSLANMFSTLWRLR